MLLVCVDDMLIAGSSMKKIMNLKARLAKEFSKKDLGLVKKILRMRINRARNEVVESVISRVREEDAEEV